MIPYGRQDIDSTDIAAVVEVLESDFLTQGPKVPEFENAVCDYTGANFGVAVNSATSALHIACLALGIGQGDLVWTSPITFVASANCALYCGAEVDFVDVDPATGNMCSQALAIKLAQAKVTGTLPKVVIPVHLCGHSCDMAAIASLAAEYGFRVIEDASHGIGGGFQGHKLGSCYYSDITVFSFHPVKIITCAEGGMAMTNSAELAEKLRLLRSHGIVRLPQQMLRPNEGDWYYEQHELGFNYRMTELQAALGVSQMKRIDAFVKRRNELANRYRQGLSSLCHCLESLAGSDSAWHLLIICLRDKSHRKHIFDDMRAAGIQVHVHYFPVHLQPFYMNKGFKQGQFPVAEDFYSRILSLPLFPGLTEEQQAYVIETLSKAL
ncbi:UDP-4-amino-4,6-dideoxy-N-acetyl-beta-L-altrosamine transaminase [Shewanella bicestrii]|uniref:UDP-4-amino-4, 6-dideoxy-N-acetyl-beta-L-altrosamine transaminase n=1 Tax=Shewanella bicestrii TaxID=2018305 RepID=A0A220UPU8_9GAMM|nr:MULTISPECIES: UDP-4-amino-4,6-dideoxy-N-acetyl-beta-L-altrosamine transaminase [Shewanella]ABK47537.1 polysaccharide biosynthesis protein [Shewanella sp. ANA-3]ASK69946.1 UDP-4-amino-4,6-dideoxy-N-acetyl-beta-L-altrosamine transaminase [Shewanella bicestrii]